MFVLFLLCLNSRLFDKYIKKSLHTLLQCLPKTKNKSLPNITRVTKIYISVIYCVTYEYSSAIFIKALPISFLWLFRKLSLIYGSSVSSKLCPNVTWSSLATSRYNFSFVIYVDRSLLLELYEMRWYLLWKRIKYYRSNQYIYLAI